MTANDLIEEYRAELSIFDMLIKAGLKEIKELGLNPVSNKSKLAKARTALNDAQTHKYFYTIFLNQLKELQQ